MKTRIPNRKPANDCWICTGRGRNLCRKHNTEAEDRAARYNITVDDAVFQLREDELELQAYRRGEI